METNRDTRGNSGREKLDDEQWSAATRQIGVHEVRKDESSREAKLNKKMDRKKIMCGGGKSGGAEKEEEGVSQHTGGGDGQREVEESEQDKTRKEDCDACDGEGGEGGKKKGGSREEEDEDSQRLDEEGRLRMRCRTLQAMYERAAKAHQVASTINGGVKRRLQGTSSGKVRERERARWGWGEGRKGPKGCQVLLIDREKSGKEVINETIAKKKEKRVKERTNE